MGRRLLLAAALFLTPLASRAVNVPLPVEGSTLNLTVFVQPQILINENGTPDGLGASYDLFIRRSRLQVNGDFSRHFSYYFQVDNTNFGESGNFTGRMIVQDAWVAWAPMGNTGPAVLFVEGGIIYYPISRAVLTSSSSQPTAEGHPDVLRGFSSTFYPANRTDGVQVRGWALGKKLGFRGGLYEGIQPSAADPGVNPKRNPALGAFVNYDIVGSEEGGFLYQSVYFAKEPILSLSAAGTYQSKALRVPKGVTDQRSLAGTLFLDYPFSEQQEMGFILSGYDYANGTGSRDTGIAFSADLWFRYRFIRPYVSCEYFNSADCPTDGSATAAQCAAVHTADSRNFRGGLDFYINKSQNHVTLEFSLNRGQSAWGAQSITAAAAGYVPAIAPGSLPLTSLGRSASKSLLTQGIAYF